jgi:hypothetical protein
MVQQQRLELLAVTRQSLESFLRRNLALVDSVLEDALMVIQDAIRAAGGQSIAFYLASATSQAGCGYVLGLALRRWLGSIGGRRHSSDRYIHSLDRCRR